MVRGRRLLEEGVEAAGLRWIVNTLRGLAAAGTVAIGFAAPVLAQTGAADAGTAPGAGPSGTGAPVVAVPAAGAPAGSGLAVPPPGGGPAFGSTGGGTGISLPTLVGGRLPIEPPRIEYGVRTSATLTDNVDRDSSGEKADLILEGSPWIQASSEAPRSQYQLTYQMRNFFSLRDSDLHLLRHNLNGRGSFALKGDNLWLDAYAFMGTIGSSVGASLSYDPASSFNNQSNFRSYSISPWYQDNLGSWATYQLRYRYTDSSGSNALLLANSSHAVSAFVDGIDRGGDWNWRWFGTFQRNDYDIANRDRRHSGGTVFYRVNSRLQLSGSLEYEQIDGVFNEDGDDHGWGPALGLDWAPNSRARFSMSIAERYYGTVGSARASWTTRRTTLGLAFSRSVLTSASATLFDLDPLSLTSGVPGLTNNVLGDLRSRGIVLPGITTLPGALITDAAMFDKRLTGYFALRGASRALTLTLYVADRETTTQVDQRSNAAGGIRGSGTGGALAFFSGQLEERGGTLAFHQTLDARSRFEAALERRLVESPTAGFENELTTLRAGVITSLTSTTRAFGGVRRSEHDAIGSGVNYVENVIFGGLDIRFR